MIGDKHIRRKHNQRSRQDDWGMHMHDQGKILLRHHGGRKQYYGQNNAMVY